MQCRAFIHSASPGYFRGALIEAVAAIHLHNGGPPTRSSHKPEQLEHVGKPQLRALGHMLEQNVPGVRCDLVPLERAALSVERLHLVGKPPGDFRRDFEGFGATGIREESPYLSASKTLEATFVTFEVTFVTSSGDE
ncbi:hypothetical protein, partial [Bradyrhizobium oropedii]|uniref:hypothetical protein n=1 Tax=Bradyrhizobium oropedii TaxID=1571201 RepID=UPI001E61CEF1